MKKLALMMIAVMFTSLSFGQKMHEKDVPATIKTSLQKLHPSAKDVKWDKEKENFEASFDLNKIDHSVLFDAKGDLLETEVEIELNQLPAGVLEYVKKHHPKHSVKEAAKITNASGTVTYETEIKGKDLFFDSNGKFIREEKN